MPNKAISDIKQFMRQIDMTNTERIGELMDAYTASVKEYNGICGQLHNFIKNGMVEEAERFLNELEPTLQEQYKELEDPTVKEFLETAEIYGMEIPVVEDIFDELGVAVLNKIGLEPLIIRYRQIARSNKTQEKLAIIRQIIAQSPEDQVDWEHTLVSLEEEWKIQLQENAKKAIISNEYQDLKAIQETILTEPWKTPFNEKVVNKIQQVLDDERRRTNQKLCEQLLQTAEKGMEKGGKINEIEPVLGKIQKLLSEDEALQMPPEWMERLQQVSETWGKAKKQAEEDALFNNLLLNLEQKMTANAPLEEIENIYYDMQRLRREIPEITVQKVEVYRQGKIAIAKRKRLVSSGIGILAFIVLAAVGVIVFKNVARNRSITEYSTRLRAAIDDKNALSDTGFEILKELETKVPGIRNEKEITVLVDELKNKKQNEEAQRANEEAKRAKIEYSARLRAAIDDKSALSDIGFEIVKELETKFPGIRNEKEIIVLVNELKNKKQNEETKRAKFEELKLILSQQLENYAKHASTIPEVLEELQKQALQEHQKTLEALTKQHDEQRAKYIRTQDATYRKLCTEAGDSFIAMKALLAEYNFKQASNCQKVITEKLKQAAELADVSLDVKDSMASLVAEYAKAGEMVNQEIIDKDLSDKLKIQEDWYESFKELIEKQDMKLVKEKLKKYDEIDEMAKSLKDDIGKGSVALKKRWEDLQTKIKETGKEIKTLMKLKEEEHKALKEALNESSLAAIQKSLKDVQKKYSSHYLSQDIDILLDDISKCLDGEVEKYDAEEIARGKRFQMKSDLLGKSLEELLQRKRKNYLQKPIYMIVFFNIKTHNDMEIYMTSGVSDNNEGLKFEKKTRIDDYTLKNVMGLKERTNVRMDPAMDRLKFGDGPYISVSLTYPSFLKNKNLDEFRYKTMGPYGDWLTTLDDSQLDFSKVDGYLFLDKVMQQLLTMKIDGVRNVEFFLELANTMLDYDPCFAEGGEFELTEILELKRELESLLACLPKGYYHWYSASWEYPDEIKTFYKKLKAFTAQDRKNYFSSAMRRLRLTYDNENKILAPVGIYMNLMSSQNVMADTEEKVNDIIIPLTSLSNGAEGDLFIADHKSKKNVRIGKFTYRRSKFQWTLEDKIESTMCVVYAKKKEMLK